MAESLGQAHLEDLAQQALELARAHGAEHADVVVERAQDFEAKVADGKIVTLTQATRLGLGLRAFVGGRLGFCAATDLTPAGLKRGVATAIAMAKTTAHDACHGLAESDAAKAAAALNLQLYDDAVVALSGQAKVDMAFAIEAAARAENPLVKKFRDSGVSTEVLHEVYASSRGVMAHHRSTNVSSWCTPVAQRGDELQTEFWYDTACHLQDLQDGEALGAMAARRAARMLGARRLKTQEVAVVFEAPAAAALLGSMLSALDGDMVHRRASFLADSLHTQVASPQLSVRDDPHLRRASGSRLLDGEGLATAPRDLIKDGRLQTFLYDGYSARRAKVAPTASAQRSAGGLPHAGPFNVVVQAGTHSDAAMLGDVPRALLVTRGLGRGLNTVSGEYSRGVSGLWLEHGEVVHPVQEVTIAGDFLQMLGDVDAVGSNVLRRGNVAAPMLRVGRMAVSGA